MNIPLLTRKQLRPRVVMLSRLEREAKLEAERHAKKPTFDELLARYKVPLLFTESERGLDKWRDRYIKRKREGKRV